MSYTPRLLIEYEDLKNIENELHLEHFSDIGEERRVADYLLNELSSNTPSDFSGTKVILISPELTHFNSLVRERLIESRVTYTIFN